jgi:hypothetical protein
MDEVLTSAPSLPSSLAYLYSKLSNEEQRVFHKVFNSMWCAVAPLKRFVHHGGVMYAYWIVDDLRMKADLSPVELSALMYLYHVSGNVSISLLPLLSILLASDINVILS